MSLCNIKTETLKKREPNFVAFETELLTTLVKTYSHILENKKTDVANNQLKEETWRKLAEDFNSTTGICQRNAKTLRAKYENMKKTLKRKYGEHRRSMYRTGGGPPRDLNLTQEEEVIMELAGPSVDGLPARFDGDLIPECDEHQISTQTEHTTKVEDNIHIIDDSNINMEVGSKVHTQHTINTVVATPELTVNNNTPHRFLLKRKRAAPLTNRNPEAFNTTMGNYGDLSKKKQDLVDAQIRSLEEKTKYEKREHELRCVQFEEKIKQETREHELRCELMMLDIMLKKKQLNQ